VVVGVVYFPGVWTHSKNGQTENTANGKDKFSITVN